MCLFCECTPELDNEMKVTTSTQWPTEIENCDKRRIWGSGNNRVAL
jgi:hypothetical protein